jgi:hypothetical protein
MKEQSELQLKINFTISSYSHNIKAMLNPDF